MSGWGAMSDWGVQGGAEVVGTSAGEQQRQHSLILFQMYNPIVIITLTPQYLIEACKYHSRD